MSDLIAPIVGIVLVIGGAMWFESAQCSSRAVSFEGYEWGPVQGCMVKEKGRWLPLDNIRGFDGK